MEGYWRDGNFILKSTTEQQIEKLTEERETLISESVNLREQKENIWKAMVIVENERDRLRNALEYSFNLQKFAKTVSTGAQDRELAKMEKVLWKMTEEALK